MSVGVAERVWGECICVYIYFIYIYFECVDRVGLPTNLNVMQCIAVRCSVLQCVNHVGVYLVISGYVYIYTEFVDRVDLSNITNLILWADLRFGCTLTVDLQRRILEVTCSYVMSRI